MALLLKRLWDQYVYIFTELPDERAAKWLLVGPAVPVIPFTIMFMYLILVQNVLPEYMNKRKPFNIRKIMIAYNLFQILASAYLLIIGYRHIIKMSVFCTPIDTSYSSDAFSILHIIWCYYMLKIIDLLDTVFFILRKKLTHVTFLHTYHHCIMVLCGWIGVRFLSGGHSAYMGYLNALVHFFMYGYYLYTLISKNNNGLFFKKFITQLQLIQFGANFIIYLLPLFHFNCGYPKITLILFVPQNLIFFCLFADFYYKTYINK